MKGINRNEACPCGSGLKYKKCCGTGGAAHLKDLTPGIRMKGGIRFDPMTHKFVVIVHTWDNVLCEGDPKEWAAPQVFPTEEKAMTYYKTSIRPSLMRLMKKIESESPGARLLTRNLE